MSNSFVGHQSFHRIIDPLVLNNIHSCIISSDLSSPSPVTPLSGLSKHKTPFSLGSFNALFHPLIYHSTLLALIRDLFQSHDVIPIQTGILTKAAGAPATPWHRDRDHLPISTNVLSAWIPLTPIRPQESIIYADRTASIDPILSQVHRDNPFDDVQHKYFSPLSCGGSLVPGDVDIHDGHIWHMAPANDTNQVRIAVGVAYVPLGSRIDLASRGFDCLSGLPVRLDILASNFPGLSDGDLIPYDPLTDSTH